MDKLTEMIKALKAYDDSHKLSGSTSVQATTKHQGMMMKRIAAITAYASANGLTEDDVNAVNSVVYGI